MVLDAQADSGGPATLDLELVGLVSWTEGCGDAQPDGKLLKII